jgi:hypothetical protein
MKSLLLLMSLLASIVFLISTERDTECLSASSFQDDRGIHNRLVVIKGKVIELNNRDLGVTPAHASTTLIFQRVGCRTCLVASRPDIDGNYEVRVGRGRYRLIVTSPSAPQYDLLAPEQQRYVDTTNSASQVITFDVRLRLPS